MAALQGIAAIRAQKQALRKTTTASLHRISSMELDQQCKPTSSSSFLPACSHWRSASHCFPSIFAPGIPSMHCHKLLSEHANRRGTNPKHRWFHFKFRLGPFSNFKIMFFTIFFKGKILFVPKIYPEESKMDFLRIYSAADLASLASGTWGIKEPGDNWEAGRRARGLFLPTSAR